MFETGVAAVMDLRYVAFGNVRNNSDGTFAYQHGPGERWVAAALLVLS